MTSTTLQMRAAVEMIIGHGLATFMAVLKHALTLS